MTDDERKKLITQWQLFCDAAAAEKSWMHERLSWLFTPQGVLFAAFILTQRDDYTDSKEIISYLQAVIPSLGVIISTSVLVGVSAAGVMHFKWTTKLNELADIINTNGGAVTFGSHPHWPARTSSFIPFVLASVFVIAWVCLLVKF